MREGREGGRQRKKRGHEKGGGKVVIERERSGERHDSQQSDVDTVYSRTYVLFADFHNPLSNLCQCMLGCEININKKLVRWCTYLYNVL